jgi:hypothetical protein
MKCIVQYFVLLLYVIHSCILFKERIIIEVDMIREVDELLSKIYQI